MKERNLEFYAGPGEKILGIVYLPDDYQAGTRLPTIIPCSGITGINAAYPALLARFFTKHGYACLGFDYRGWAPSEGRVGYTTHEEEYLDIEAAYIFATQQPEFDPENIGLFGWGFSAPIVLKLTANYPEIKAVGCGNGFYNGERYMRTLLNLSDFTNFIEITRQDRIRRVMTGEGALTSPYHQGGVARSFAYFQEKLEPLTLDWLLSDDVFSNRKKAGNTTTFMDLERTKEAIARDYNGDFPPRQSFVTTDSTLRVDAKPDVQKIAPRPIFIVHAIEDDSYPVSEAYAIAADIGVTCTTCFVHGDHNSFMFDDDPEFQRFSRSILGFYDKALKG